jgi:hypothetical protein
MEIKPLNNGAVRPQNAEPGASPKSPQPDSAMSLDAAPPGALDSVRAKYKRADLGTAQWDSILRKSIDALLDSAAASGSPMPSAVRQKAADFLAADPLFSSRVRVYWEKNLN